MKRIACAAYSAALIVWISATMFAQSQSKTPIAQPKPDQAQQLTQALAQCTDELGLAHTKLGPLERVDALRQSGQLVSPQQLVSAIEKANGIKIGPDLKIVPGEKPVER